MVSRSSIDVIDSIDYRFIDSMIEISSFQFHIIFFSIIKQDIRISPPNSRPNGWTEWAEFFEGTHGYPNID